MHNVKGWRQRSVYANFLLEIKSDVAHLSRVLDAYQQWSVHLKKGSIGRRIISLALSIREESESATESIDSLSQAGMF